MAHLRKIVCIQFVSKSDSNESKFPYLTIILLHIGQVSTTIVG